MSKEKIRRKARWKRLEATTNFYPTYVDGNKDKVTPTAATFTTQFQTVIPRYNLSMTETRNEWTGPTFLETEYRPTSLRPNQFSNYTAIRKRKFVPISGNKIPLSKYMLKRN